MRFGIFIPVAFAAATTLAGGGGWSGMAGRRKRRARAGTSGKPVARPSE